MSATSPSIVKRAFARGAGPKGRSNGLLLQKRDKELALAFNDPRRSGMMIQLLALYMRGILQPEEFARFTPETRTRIESVVAEARRVREPVKLRRARSPKEW